MRDVAISNHPDPDPVLIPRLVAPRTAPSRLAAWPLELLSNANDDLIMPELDAV